MAEVLSNHAIVTTAPDGKSGTCFCGLDLCWRLPTIHSRTNALSAHHEVMLTAAGFGLVVDAKAEAWDEGKAATFNDPVGIAFGDVTNPYRAAASRGQG